MMVNILKLGDEFSSYNMYLPESLLHCMVESKYELRNISYVNPVNST